MVTVPALFLASHLYSPESSTWQSLITRVKPLTDWLMSYRPPVFIGLLFLNHWNEGSGVPMARQAKRTELPSTADLSRSFRMNSGSRSRSFGFWGSGLSLGAVSGGGADFSNGADSGAIAVSMTRSGSFTTSGSVFLETGKKRRRKEFKEPKSTR